MNLAALNVKTGLAATAALLAGLTAVSACTSKSEEKSASGEITVTSQAPPSDPAKPAAAAGSRGL